LVGAHPILEIFQADSPVLGADNGSEVIAVANTYIVFTTFIFVIITIILTAIGVGFAKWFGISKEKEIKENMRDLFEHIHSDSEVAKKFVKELFSNREISGHLQSLVEAKVEEEKKSLSVDDDADLDFMSDLVKRGKND